MVFAIAFLVATVGGVVVLWRVNPIFAARSKVQVGTKPLDYLFIAVAVGGYVLILPVAGLDFRFGGFNVPDWLVWLGFIGFALAHAGEGTGG